MMAFSRDGSLFFQTTGRGGVEVGPLFIDPNLSCSYSSDYRKGIGTALVGWHISTRMLHAPAHCLEVGNGARPQWAAGAHLHASALPRTYLIGILKP